MAVRFAPGSVFRVDVPGGRCAWAVMLEEFPHFAFYADDAGPEEGKPPGAEPLFILAVQRNAYAGGGWGKPVAELDREQLPAIPEFFRQDDDNPGECLIVDVEGNERVAAPAECEGLEREAVWAASHVEERLADHYAGRRNATVEDFKVKR